MLIFLNIFIIFCIFIIGTLFGSFFSLATYRLPRHEDIVATRSYCTSCHHRLGFFDLIPVLSYIIRGGKCKYCKERISIRYFLLEMSNGILFVLLYLVLGYTIKLLIAILIYVLVFVFIGSYIMKKRISEEEKRNIEALKISKKRGVFISELVIAMILFTILLTSTYIISRNSNKKSDVLIAKSNAISLAVKNIEMALVTEYDSLYSSENTETINNIVYKTVTSVQKYSDIDFSKEDVIKKVNIRVSYMINGEPHEYILNTLKGKVL